MAVDAYQMDFAQEASALLVEAERLRLLAELASHRLTGLGIEERRALAAEVLGDGAAPGRRAG